MTKWAAFTSTFEVIVVEIVNQTKPELCKMALESINSHV